jgi:hypothetical protein
VSVFAGSFVDGDDVALGLGGAHELFTDRVAGLLQGLRGESGVVFLGDQAEYRLVE